MDFVSENFSNELFQCSLLLVDPNPSFYELLNKLTPIDPKIQVSKFSSSDRNNSAYIIPAYGLFKDGDKFKEYLNQLKPELLNIELSAYESYFPDIRSQLDIQDFDTYFTVSIRTDLTTLAVQPKS